MKTKIMKWGNSYAVRLPKQVIEDLELEEESELSIEQKGNILSLRKPAKEAQLAILLKNMKPQRELEWGKARGKEAW